MLKRLVYATLLLILLTLAACNTTNEEIPNEPIGDPETDMTEPDGEQSSDEEVNETTPESDRAITDFSLEIDTTENNELIDIEYEEERNGIEAKYQADGENLTGEEARPVIEDLLTSLSLHSDMSNEDIISLVLEHFNITEDQVVDFDLEVEFNGVKEIDIDWN
ncbi:YusW family protein [Alkalihalobacillus sp. 1P02AB]|uniref:YusW family protein n=1 Tax=Alkalihalobacillus sp. 1P02AB TaxID=3132260 RepID=UPI0039A5604E